MVEREREAMKVERQREGERGREATNERKCVCE